MPDKIFIVDDDVDTLKLVGLILQRQGYDVRVASSGSQALSMMQSDVPDLLLLDIMMPEMDGMETCNEIRQIPELRNSIVIFLTARGEDYSQIAGFEAGADDYVTKPIKPKVLISRIKALLRRYKDEPAPGANRVIQVDEFTIDRDKYTVEKSGETLHLPRKEFELLSLLVSRPNKVFTREEILSMIWGDDVIVGDRTIDVHVRKLREKLDTQNIRTIKGVGYKYEI